jgi:hypothetical protein
MPIPRFSAVWWVCLLAASGCDPVMNVSRSTVVPAPLSPVVVKAALREAGAGNVTYERLEQGKVKMPDDTWMEPPYDRYVFQNDLHDPAGIIYVGIDPQSGYTLVQLFSDRIGWQLTPEFLKVRPLMDRITVRLRYYVSSVPELRDWTETVFDRGRERPTVPGEPVPIE